MKKIALIGSAPSSVKRAPYDDPSWTIFACSPGAIGHCRRIDHFFEMHAWRPENPCCEINYVKKLAALECPVYMVNPVPDVPTSVSYPKEQVLGWSYGTVRNHKGEERHLRFNPNDFASSLSWMLAFAIMQGPEEIGLWGVDMAANEEYGGQKDGCLALIHIAKSLGIRITVPPESDLLRPAPLYGYQEHDHMYIKLNQRLLELDQRINEAIQREGAAREERMFLMGAKDDIVYTLRTWIADGQAIHRMFSEPEDALNPRDGIYQALLDGEEAEPGFAPPPRARRNPKKPPHKHVSVVAREEATA